MYYEAEQKEFETILGLEPGTLISFIKGKLEERIRKYKNSPDSGE